MHPKYIVYCRSSREETEAILGFFNFSRKKVCCTVFYFFHCLGSPFRTGFELQRAMLLMNEIISFPYLKLQTFLWKALYRLCYLGEYLLEEPQLYLGTQPWWGPLNAIVFRFLPCRGSTIDESGQSAVKAPNHSFTHSRHCTRKTTLPFVPWIVWIFESSLISTYTFEIWRQSMDLKKIT